MSLTGAVSRNTIWSPQAPMMANAMSYVRPRQPELDFIKGVMIVLVVVFHLGYIGDLYPTAKALVYTFHMPTFLLLSGYLLHTQRPAAAFGRKLLWIFVPYAVMESAYVVASAIMPDYSTKVYRSNGWPSLRMVNVPAVASSISFPL